MVRKICLVMSNSDLVVLLGNEKSYSLWSFILLMSSWLSEMHVRDRFVLLVLVRTNDIKTMTASIPAPLDRKELPWPVHGTAPWAITVPLGFARAQPKLILWKMTVPSETVIKCPSLSKQSLIAKGFGYPSGKCTSSSKSWTQSVYLDMRCSQGSFGSCFEGVESE